jgi:hypothetical protein
MLVIADVEQDGRAHTGLEPNLAGFVVSGVASAHGVLSGYRRDWQRFESIARPR